MAVTTLGSFSGANDKDKSARIPAAIAALNKALAGDSASYTYMVGQSQGSATAVGKEAFRRALAIYAQTPPDRRLGWSIGPSGWTFTAPAPSAPAAPFNPPLLVNPQIKPPILLAKPPIVPTVDTHGAQGAPLGFDPHVTGDPLMHSPVIVPSVTVSGVAPGIITPVNIGATDGGVTTGPSTEYGGASTPAAAPASFGYVAPAQAPIAAATATDGAPATSQPPVDMKMVLILAAGVVLWLLVDGSRKK
jgi:hypothetical protein